VTGDDMTVRRITVQALGPNYGSVVVVDSSTGRVLSILNQKLALGDGFQPCSTFKVSIALAALSEKVIAPGDTVPVGRTNIDLTDALAHSNNHFFANLGCELGFEKVSHYAHQFGYGEKAGVKIVGEGAGHFAPAPRSSGGVGRTKAGLDSARREGRIGGRRPKLTPQQQSEIRKMVSKGHKDGSRCCPPI